MVEVHLGNTKGENNLKTSTFPDDASAKASLALRQQKPWPIGTHLIYYILILKSQNLNKRSLIKDVRTKSRKIDRPCPQNVRIGSTPLLSCGHHKFIKIRISCTTSEIP